MVLTVDTYEISQHWVGQSRMIRRIEAPTCEKLTGKANVEPLHTSFQHEINLTRGGSYLRHSASWE